MKTITVIAALTLGLAASAMAAEFKGFVEDTACSTKPGMKDNAACAQKCIKGGEKPVLVVDEKTVYTITNPDILVPHAGEKVTVEGTLKGSALTVKSVKM